jgi:hypothetical protein
VIGILIGILSQLRGHDQDVAQFVEVISSWVPANYNKYRGDNFTVAMIQQQWDNKLYGGSILDPVINYDS